MAAHVIRRAITMLQLVKLSYTEITQGVTTGQGETRSVSDPLQRDYRYLAGDLRLMIGEKRVALH